MAYTSPHSVRTGIIVVNAIYLDGHGDTCISEQTEGDQIRAAIRAARESHTHVVEGAKDERDRTQGL